MEAHKPFCAWARKIRPVNRLEVHSIEPAAEKTTVLPVKDPAEGVAAVASGRVDGYASDRVVLAGLKLRDPKAADLVFVDNDFSFEPYALVVRRDDPDFRLAVNRGLVAVYRSGEIDAIFLRWLGPLGRPGALLHSMFYLNTLPD